MMMQREEALKVILEFVANHPAVLSYFLLMCNNLSGTILILMYVEQDGRNDEHSCHGVASTGGKGWRKLL